MNFISLPQMQPRTGAYETEGLGNALSEFGNVRRGIEQQTYQRGKAQEEQTYQRGRDAKGDDERQKALWGKRALAFDQMPDGPNKPAMWKQLTRGQTGLTPEEMDYRTGPKLMAAQAGLYNDPRDSQMKDAELLHKQAQTNVLNRREDQSKVVEVNGRLVRYGPNGAEDITPSTMEPRASKTDEMFARETYKSDFKTVNEYRDQADGAGDVRSGLDELRAARQGTNMEGPIMGYLPNISPSSQRVVSAAENVRLGFVQKTKGAVSDAEMRIFGLATPGMNMSDAAAAPMIDGMQLAAQRVQERSVFFDQWIRARGSLDGAQPAWKKFTEDMPIIQQDRTGKFVLKPENVGAWKQYFGGGQPQGGVPQPQPQTAPEVTGSSQSFARPQTKQDYDSMPPGTRYLDPNGTPRTKQ